MTIFLRLSLGFLLLILVFLVLGGYTVWKLQDLNRIAHKVSTGESRAIRLTEQIRDTLLTQAELREKFRLTADPGFLEQSRRASRVLRQQVARLRGTLSGSESLDLVRAFEDRYERVMAKGLEVGPGLGPVPEPAGLEPLQRHMERIARSSKADLRSQLQQAEAIGTQSVRFTLLITGAAVVLALGIASLNARTINRPVLALMQGTKRIERGDFHSPLAIDSPPEIRELAASFNAMAAKLGELNRMKEDFISQVSHELRTPLTSIRAATELLLQRGPDTSPAKLQRRLEIIREESERLTGLVNTLLDLSRLESGMVEYSLEEADLAEAVQRCASAMGALAEERGLDLQTELEEAPCLVLMDREKIEQAVINLLGNAVKFTPSGGAVRLSVRTVPAAQGEQAGQAEVCVCDTGPGLEPEALEEVFEKFRKGQGGGSGLGLAIARHIIAAHQGEIWAASTPGSGSRFCFTLPLA